MKTFVAAAMICLLLSGCGANYVAKNKDFGTPLDGKPVIGIAVVDFTINERMKIDGSPIAQQFAQGMAEKINEQGCKAKALSPADLNGPQTAKAISKFLAIPKMKRKDINENFDFGPIKDDLKASQVDLLMIISGDATIPSGSLGALTANLGMNMATVMAGGIGVGSYPFTLTFTAVANGDGKPQYATKQIYTMIGKRDFADADHRKKMASDISDSMVSALFK